MRSIHIQQNNLCLIRLLTFVSVIGSQFLMLITSAAVVAVKSTPFDAFNKTISTPEAGSSIHSSSSSSSSPSSATISHTFSTSPTSSVLYETKTSIAMNNVVSSTSFMSNSMTVVPDGSATVSTHQKNIKSTSKMPTGFTFSKNHWSSPGTINLGGTLPHSSSATTTEFDRSRTFRNKHHHEHHWGPFFEEPLNSTSSGDNLISTAHLFTEAILNCRVGMLKDKTVMWVRRTTEKVSLLTVGNVTYSGDPRVRVKFQYPNNWRLLINPAQKEDAGLYMCQVSTHPPRVSTTNLTILEPPLRLIDDQEREVSDRYYKSGSTIDLQCQVSRSFVLKEKSSILKSIKNRTKNNTFKTNTGISHGTILNELNSSTNQSVKEASSEKQFSNFIFWNKDDEALPATAVKRISTSEKWLNSRISIPDARLTDSGNYTCSIGKLFAAIVQVQVLTGELPAAVQHNSAQMFHQRLHTFLYQWAYLTVAFTIIWASKTLRQCNS